MPAPKQLSHESVAKWIEETFGFRRQEIDSLDTFAGIVRPTWLEDKDKNDLSVAERYEVKMWELIDSDPENTDNNQEIKHRACLIWYNHWAAQSKGSQHGR